MRQKILVLDSIITGWGEGSAMLEEILLEFGIDWADWSSWNGTGVQGITENSWPDEVAGIELVSCNIDQADEVCVDDTGGWTWVILELSEAGNKFLKVCDLSRWFMNRTLQRKYFTCLLHRNTAWGKGKVNWMVRLTERQPGRDLCIVDRPTPDKCHGKRLCHDPSTSWTDSSTMFWHI